MIKKNSTIKEAAREMQQAMTSGDSNKMTLAWEKMQEAIADTVKTDMAIANGDKQILAQRGYRQLTSAEEKFYNAMIKAGKSNAPKQELTSLLDTAGMPGTIIEDVYKNLVEEHPLLDAISFTTVSYLTKWILNDHTKDTAVWGEVTDEISKEITSAFKEIDLVQCKLSAYAIIPRDMLDLGPEYLDNYVRTVLSESLAAGLEAAIISGDGANSPIGLDRNIASGVAVTDGAYPQKDAVELTSLSPAEYGSVLAELATTENGLKRKLDKVVMVVNQTDYLTKIMPATVVATANGTYARDFFPFATEVVISNEVEDNKAIIFLPDEYFMAIGNSKDGVIEYSDEFKFLEDKRVFKIKMYGNGRAYDNTCAILCDITNLEPAYIPVKEVATTEA